MFLLEGGLLGVGGVEGAVYACLRVVGVEDVDVGGCGGFSAAFG